MIFVYKHYDKVQIPNGSNLDFKGNSGAQEGIGVLNSKYLWEMLTILFVRITILQFVLKFSNHHHRVHIKHCSNRDRDPGPTLYLLQLSKFTFMQKIVSKFLLFGRIMMLQCVILIGEHLLMAYIQNCSNIDPRTNTSAPYEIQSQT